MIFWKFWNFSSKYKYAYANLWSPQLIKILLCNVFSHEQLKAILLFFLITQNLNRLHTNCKIEKVIFSTFFFWKRLVKALDSKITRTINFQINIYSFLREATKKLPWLVIAHDLMSFRNFFSISTTYKKKLHSIFRKFVVFCRNFCPIVFSVYSIFFYTLL